MNKNGTFTKLEQECQLGLSWACLSFMALLGWPGPQADFPQMVSVENPRWSVIYQSWVWGDKCWGQQEI